MRTIIIILLKIAYVKYYIQKIIQKQYNISHLYISEAREKWKRNENKKIKQKCIVQIRK